MAEIYVAISVFLILYLILIQKLSIRFIYDGNANISFDYSLFKLALTPSGNKEFITPYLRSVKPIKNALDELLERSEIKLNALHYETAENDPHKFSVRYKNLFSLISIAIAYLSRKTKKLNVYENAVSVISDGGTKNKLKLDVEISAPLHVFFIPAFKLFLIARGTKKRKSRRSEARNVGK